MKRTAACVSLAFAASIAFGSLALAEEKSSTGLKEGSGQAQQTQDKEQSQAQSQSKMQQSGIETADDVQGFTVQNSSGEQLGKISELLVDVDQGKIGYAVVSSGGVLGMGEEKYIVPFKALKFDPAQNALTLDMQKDQLKKAPQGDVAAAINREQGQEIHQFYGVSPYWEDDSTQLQPSEQKPELLLPSDQQQQDQQQLPQDQQNRSQPGQKDRL